MKRFVAKYMHLSFGPRGCDIYRGASQKKRRAIRKVCFRKWKSELAKDGGYLPSERPAWNEQTEMFANPVNAAGLAKRSGTIVTK